MPKYVPIPGSEVDLQDCRRYEAVHPLQRIEVYVLVRRPPSGPPLPTLEELSAARPLREAAVSHEQFETTYGADRDDIAQVEKFAAAQGLVVVDVNKASRTVTLSGHCGIVGQAFGVELYHFENSDDGQFRGHEGPVQVPEALGSIVTGVFGIDTRPVAKPHFRHYIAAAEAAAAGPFPGSFLPTQVAEAYRFPPHTTGAGQTVALIELGGGYQLEYLRQYFDAIRGPVPEIDWVSVAGGQNQAGGAADAEVYLDIEILGAAAPGAKQVVYFAPNYGMLQALQAATHDPKNDINVISLSWGAAESSNRSYINAVNEVIQEAAYKGKPVCVAVGDNGSSDTAGPGGSTVPAPDGLAHVNFPASSPYALACGGTTLVASGATIESEVAWNVLDRNSGATGGGVSAHFAVPSYQQHAGLEPRTVNPGNQPGRGVPDVAGHADPLTGYLVQVGPNQPAPVGGTSAVAPLWAALIARLNEALGSHVSFLNGFLYRHGHSSGNFNGVTLGNNNSSPLVGGYTAGPGWDACTGWGSPVGVQLLENLRKLT